MTLQDEADAVLAAALVAHARAYEYGGDSGHLLSEYAVVAGWQPEEENNQTRYTVAYHTATVPAHVALGLFHIGIGFIRHGDEED